jgi:hypothetical protein
MLTVSGFGASGYWRSASDTAASLEALPRSGRAEGQPPQTLHRATVGPPTAACKKAGPVA